MGGVTRISLVLMVLSAAMGFFLIGAMIGLYTIAPALYGPASRVTGVGLAIGVGRLGAIAAPFAGGLMLEAQMGVGYVYSAFAVHLLSLRRWQCGQFLLRDHLQIALAQPKAGSMILED